MYKLRNWILIVQESGVKDGLPVACHAITDRCSLLTWQLLIFLKNSKVEVQYRLYAFLEGHYWV